MTEAELRQMADDELPGLTLEDRVAALEARERARDTLAMAAVRWTNAYTAWTKPERHDVLAAQPLDTVTLPRAVLQDVRGRLDAMRQWASHTAADEAQYILRLLDGAGV